MKKSLLVVSAVVAFAAQAYLPEATPESQGISSRAIRAWIDRCEKDVDALHGFVFLRHGRLVAEGYWKPYERDRTHMLYSHSKSFTATAVGFLVDEGKVDLDERVVDVFPEKLPKDPSENLRAMRVRDLLTMNTGSERDSTGPISAASDGDWVRAFMAHPVERRPGTWFVYNTGATYMLSALVERRSGEKLMDFLAKRLFRPIGIEKAWSTTCPKGVACGGYGMNMTTRELALFGQFCLQRGSWDGRRLLSEDWIALMTSKQTETRHSPDGDWGRGYGFQFWRCVPRGVYRADGARGQYTVVMPEQDAVLSITAGVGDMQKELSLVWELLLPAMKDAPLPEDELGREELKGKCASLCLPMVNGAKEGGLSVVMGKEFVFESNGRGIKSVTLSQSAGGWDVVVDGPFGVQRIPVGHGEWKYGSLRLEKERHESLGALVGEQPTASSGAWTAPDVFTCRTYLCGGPACFDMTLKFTAATLVCDVKFTAMRSPKFTLVGVAK